VHSVVKESTGFVLELLLRGAKLMGPPQQRNIQQLAV
jgi:hypothetical protein